jgi:uncharacterized protein YqcC (DUF446 family)
VALNNTQIKVNEIIDELKKNGLWKRKQPLWVSDFEKIKIVNGQDFTDWLQFVYLPNILSGKGGVTIENRHIVPQVVSYFGDDIKKGKLLELLIELDALMGCN